MADEIPEFDEIPTKDLLVPPKLEDVPLTVLANTLAIRSIRHDLREAKTWFKRMVGAFIGGSLTIATAVIGAAYTRGARDAAVDSAIVEVSRHDERITHLERKAVFYDEGYSR